MFYKAKQLLIPLFVFPLLVVGTMGSAPARAGVAAQDFDAAAYFASAKCAMCHSAKAEKHFDATKADDVLVAAILQGVKLDKPPAMPGYEAKGVTADQAKALVAYMKSLKQ